MAIEIAGAIHVFTTFAIAGPASRNATAEECVRVAGFNFKRCFKRRPRRNPFFAAQLQNAAADLRFDITRRSSDRGFRIATGARKIALLLQAQPAAPRPAPSRVPRQPRPQRPWRRPR